MGELIRGSSPAGSLGGGKWLDLVQSLTPGVCGISLAMNSRCAEDLAGSFCPKEKPRVGKATETQASYSKAPRTQSCVLPGNGQRLLSSLWPQQY